MSEHIKTLSKIVRARVDEEAARVGAVGLHSVGSFQQRERLWYVAAYCVETWPGDLIEIGPHTGVTTRGLAKIALASGRRVIAVDPWEPGTQDCQGWEYEQFCQIMEPYWDITDVIRLPSQDEQAVVQIKARSLCFAFIDGLHEYEALLTDIRTVAHCAGLIAVDDINWRPADLRPAFWEGAEETRRELYWHPLCREGYLLP